MSRAAHTTRNPASQDPDPLPQGSRTALAGPPQAISDPCRGLGPADLARPAPELAPWLIGCHLVHGSQRGRITEVEAYQGEDDRACHASRGRTPRTEVLYGQPGLLYIYLCYGIHDLLNLVCDRAGVPAAVLVRSLAMVDGTLANGPGKATRALHLDRRAHGRCLGHADCPLLLEEAVRRPTHLVAGPRVGVAYAGPYWANRPWRWWEPGFPVVAAAGGRRVPNPEPA